MSEISISTPHHQLKGYLAAPPGNGPWPGVIVLHDIFGMSDVTRGHADWLAKEGFLAVAPDLFSWAGRIRCIRSLMADLTAQKGPSFAAHLAKYDFRKAAKSSAPEKFVACTESCTTRPWSPRGA